MRIAITSTSHKPQAESFIEAHKSRLKGELHFLYGDNLPKYGPDGALSLYPGIGKRLMKKLGLKQAAESSPLEAGIKDYLSRKRIDIVLSEFGTSGAMMSPICKELQIPLIVHFHGGDAVIEELLRNFRERYLEMFDYCARIVVVSKDMKTDLLSIGAPEKKILLNPCGARESFQQIKPAFNEPHFLFIGRFVDKKAPYYLVCAMKRVLESVPEAKLDLVGEGPLLNATKNLAKHLGISDKLVFHGAIEHPNLKPYLEKASCYVQHSIVADNGDAEGTPVSILEAASAGLPVVSTRHKGIKQAVVDHTTGFLVDEHDVAAMAEKMIEVITDLEKARLMGMAAQQHVLKNYAIETHIARLDLAIAEAVNGN
ncbi:MAG: hypothetical protein CSA96_05250 [Bacteroidetes bacterium]|nr:MAG: hypothetical protein CSA96_05250 [Bacteroidota bacterium]